MNTKPHFTFSKNQRNGVLVLVLLIVVAQVGYFLIDFSKPSVIEIDDEVVELQAEIDSLKQAAITDQKPKIYPFNPNFITDYRGYTLGMSPKEIDRLHHYRAQDRWVNSAKEFQQVTKVSDSLLAAIEPYFKFPDWVTNPTKTNRSYSDNEKTFAQKHDLNKATAIELQEVYGIGKALSNRIVTYRNEIGGFLIDEQLYDVYGLEFLAVQNITKEFTVKTKPAIQKININTASASDIATHPLLTFEVAREIIDYRLLHEGFDSLPQLKRVKKFPTHKFDRITLYLSLD